MFIKHIFFGKLYSKGKNVFKGGKQKTTGTEVVNPFKANPQTRESAHKIEMATIPGQVQRKFMPVMRDLQKASVASKQAVQKLKAQRRKVIPFPSSTIHAICLISMLVNL